MQLRTITDLKNDLRGKVYGDYILEDSGIFRVADEAFRKVSTKINPAQLIKRQLLQTSFSGVGNEFVLPDDCDSVLNIRMALRPTKSLKFSERGKIKNNDLFDEYRMSFRNGKKVLVLDTTQFYPTPLIHKFDSTDNIVISNATDLKLEKTNVLENKAVSGLLTAATSPSVITQSGLNIDLSDNESIIANVFLGDQVDTDGAKFVDSVELEISDGTNTESITVTSNQASDSIEYGWNSLVFNLDETAVADRSAITQIKYTITHTGSTQNIPFVLDNVYANIGEAIEVEYVSDNAFYNTVSGFVRTPENLLDTIILDDDAYQIFLTQCARIITHEIQGEDAESAEITYRRELYGSSQNTGMYEDYKSKYGGSHEPKIGSYYQSKATKRSINQRA